MADRPWVTPEEVKEYSEIPAVQQRSDTRLTVDIARAEQYVITYTHNSLYNVFRLFNRETYKPILYVFYFFFTSPV